MRSVRSTRERCCRPPTSDGDDVPSSLEYEAAAVPWLTRAAQHVARIIHAVDRWVDVREKIPLRADQHRPVQRVGQVTAVEEVARLDAEARHVFQQVQLALAGHAADREQVFAGDQRHLVQAAHHAAARGRGLPQSVLGAGLQKKQRRAHPVGDDDPETRALHFFGGGIRQVELQRLAGARPPRPWCRPVARNSRLV